MKTAYAFAKTCKPGQQCYSSHVKRFAHALIPVFGRIKVHDEACEAGDNAQFVNVVGFVRVWNGTNTNDKVLIPLAAAALDANLTLP